MRKVVMYRSLTVSVASAFMLAACVPSWSPVAPQSTGAGVPTEANPAQVVPQETLAAGTVKGLVMAFNKLSGQFEPLVGAQVQVLGTKLVALTDKDGSYTLTGVAPGKHEVLVTREGYEDGKTAINANAVWGLSQVNVAMIAASAMGNLDRAANAGDTYELQQVASPNEPATNAPVPREVTVVGVVTDPRGVAVPNAKVSITTSGGTIAAVGASSATLDVAGSPTAGTVLTTPSGFFACRVADAVGRVEVRAGAYGFSPGRIAMERRNVLVTSTIGNTLPMSLQMDSFQAVAQPRPSGGQSVGALVPGGLATLQVDSGLSERADEFFIRVRRGTSLVDVWEVLPLAVTSTNGVGTVQFRVPSLIPTGQVQIQLVQLGIQATNFAPEFNAIGYTATTFENSVVAGTPSLVDDTTQSGVNFGLLERDDEAVYEVPLQNTNGSVSVQLNLVAELASGAIPVSAMLTGMATPIATASLGSNRWRFTGLMLPAATTRTFSLRVRNGATGLPHDGSFLVRQVSVEEPNFSYTKALPTAERTGANALTYREFFNEAGSGGLGWSIFAKEFEDADVATSGQAIVKLTLTPPSGTRPLSALRITDITRTNISAPTEAFTEAASTTVGATVTLADLGTLVLEVDGVARQIPVANGASTTSLTTQYENFGGTPGSVIFEKPSGGRWKFTRNSIAPGTSIRVRGTTGSPASTQAVLTAMGILNTGTTLASSSGGVSVTLVGATVQNTDNSPSLWSVRAVRNDTVVDGGDASLTIPASSTVGSQFAAATTRNFHTAMAFELVPPTQANPLPNRNAQVVVRYRINANSSGTPLNLGGTHVSNGSIARLVGFSLVEGAAGNRYATFTVPANVSGNNVRAENIATSAAF